MNSYTNIKLASEEVRRERTPASVPEIGKALAQAYSSVTGKTPNDAVVRCLLAQVIAEIGWDARGLWNYNLGNIMFTKGFPTFYKMYVRSDAPKKWRAYPSLEAGAVGFVKLISNRYGSALSAAESGDVNAYAQAISSGGYVGGKEEEKKSYVGLITGIEKTLRSKYPEITKDLDKVQIRKPEESSISISDKFIDIINMGIEAIKSIFSSDENNYQNIKLRKMAIKKIIEANIINK